MDRDPDESPWSTAQQGADILTAEQVAKLFGVTAAAARRAAALGRLPARKLFNRWYFSRSGISAYLSKSNGGSDPQSVRNGQRTFHADRGDSARAARTPTGQASTSTFNGTEKWYPPARGGRRRRK